GGRALRHGYPVHDMAHLVVAEGDVMDSARRAATVLVLGIQENRRAVLSLGPDVLEQVSLNQFAYRSFVFQRVLDDKSSAEVRRTALPPGEWFEQVIATEFHITDVGAGTAATPQDRGSCSFQEVVDDLDRTGACY